MKRTYFTPSLKINDLYQRDVMTVSDMVVDTEGTMKDHIQGWEFGGN